MYYDQEYLAYKPIGNKVVLDFSGCKYPMDVQYLLKEKFGLPEYYGNNWDALWDVLRFRWIESDGDVSVEIHGYNKMSEIMRDYCKDMLIVFDDVHAEVPNVVFKLIS